MHQQKPTKSFQVSFSDIQLCGAVENKNTSSTKVKLAYWKDTNLLLHTMTALITSFL